MSENTIHIENVGPIESLDLPLPEGGGVVVLHGRNGAGKSSAIRAVHALAGGDEKLTVRDGEPAGNVVGLGASLHVSVAAKKRQTRGGELVARSLGSDVDPSVLVDPGLVSEEAADGRRARVLCALAGAPADLDRFARLVGGSEVLEELASTKAAGASDLPTMAGLLKRDIEKAARASEETVEREESRAMGLTSGLSDVDLDAPSDEGELRAAVEAAADALAEARGAARGAAARAEKHAAAQAELERALEQTAGVSVEDAEAEHRAAVSEQAAADDEVKRIEAALSAARAEARRLADAATAKAERLALVRSTLAQVDAARAVVDAGLGDPGPDESSLAALQRAHEDAVAALERGTLVREARRRHNEAAVHLRAAQGARSHAEKLRAAARGCWDVVAEAVAKLGVGGLRFADGRLVIDTDRGTVPFSELSEGERWSVALPACIAAVGEGGLLAIEQEAWEGLDPDNRARIQAAAVEAGVWIATQGDLRAGD